VQPIPVGFVGLGRIASLLEDDPLREKPATHAGAVAHSPRCFIAGGTDTVDERRSLFARRWDAPVFTDVYKMVQSVAPEILVIATHPESHLYYLRAARRLKIPVVICEKPIAPGYHAGKKMVALERSGDIRVVVNHERRFSRDYILAGQAVAAGTFGKLLAMQGRLFFGGRSRHDRVFLHDGTHMVDALHFLAGDRLHLHRKVGRYRSSSSSVFLHGTTQRDRIPVVMEIGAERKYLHFEITLSFEDGEIRLGNGIFQWFRGRQSPYYSSYRSLMELHRSPPRPTGYFSGMVEEAVRLVDDPRAVSKSSLEDGLAAMKVITKAGLLW
jgi:predicted dehydrogenase